MATADDSIDRKYASYKRCTNIALHWLQSQVKARKDFSGQVFKTTAEILQAAEKVRSSQTKVPSYVVSALRDAINHRWKVYEIYTAATDATKDRETKSRDESHKAFVMRLEKTLKILLPLVATRSGDGSFEAMPTKQVGLDGRTNRFDVLHQADNVEEADGSLDSFNPDHNPELQLPDSSNIDTPAKARSEEDLLLEDDAFGEFMELSFFITELDTILVTLNTYWEEAAKKQLPIPVAAWLSSTAFHAIERIFTRISHIASDYDILLTKWFKQRTTWPIRFRFRGFPDLHTGEGRFWDYQPLWLPGKLLQHCRTEKEYEKILPTAGDRQNPETFIAPPTESWRDMSGADDIALDKMQESMRLILSTNRAISNIEPSKESQYICEPLLPVVDKVLKDKSEPIPLHLVFGYEMLLSSFKAYLWADGKLNKQNCRLTALKFAMQIQQSMQTALKRKEECNCNDGDRCSRSFYKRNIEIASRSLSEYTREARFDLYHQAPWVAGCHIVELLTFSMYEGLNLCFKTGHACAVLHLYNALRHLEPRIPQIKVLDQLCELFLDELFSGTLPADNFPSHFRRALGGKISKSPSETPRSTRLALSDKGQAWKSVPKNMSLFYDLYNDYYCPTMEIWETVYLGRDHGKATRKQQNEILREIHEKPFNVPLNKLKDAVLQEFTGPLPVARLNYFAIHTFCAEILGNLVKVNEPLVATNHVTGVQIVDALLEIIMEHLRDNFRRHLLEYYRPLNLVKTVFAEVDAELSLDKLVWSI